ncbi:calnexin-like isoform X1 [Argopecten irradians]|uniref:calnexin-like isoform X1 n=1 Tax=Argopecten irradians TaxID=31199 RepID=UPI00371F6141
MVDISLSGEFYVTHVDMLVLLWIQKSIWKTLHSAADQYPWLWAIYIVVLLLPVLLLSICLCPRTGPITPEKIQSHKKKTDEASPDETEEKENGEEEEEEEDVGPGGDNPPQTKKSKADLEADETNDADEEEEEETEENTAKKDSPRRSSPRKRKPRKD